MYVLLHLSNNSHMRPRKQTRAPSVAAPEPVVVDILRLGDIRAARENQLIFDCVFRVPCPQGVDDEANAAVRREAAEWWDIPWLLLLLRWWLWW